MFEALMADVNAAAMGALSDVTAIVNGGVLSVRGRFERDPVQALGLVNGATSALTALEADWEQPRRDDEVVIGAQAYRVVGVARDGQGMTLVSLAVW